MVRLLSTVNVLFFFVSQLLVPSILAVKSRDGARGNNYQIRGLQKQKSTRIKGGSKGEKGITDRALKDKKNKLGKSKRLKEIKTKTSKGTYLVTFPNENINNNDEQDMYVVTRGDDIETYMVRSGDNGEYVLTLVENGDEDNDGRNKKGSGVFGIRGKEKGTKAPKEPKGTKAPKSGVNIQRYDTPSTFYVTTTEGGSSNNQIDPVYMVLKDSTSETTIGCVHGCSDNLSDSTILVDSDGDGKTNYNIYVEKAKHQGKYQSSGGYNNPFAFSSTGTSSSTVEAVANASNENDIIVQNTNMEANVQNFTLDTGIGNTELNTQYGRIPSTDFYNNCEAIRVLDANTDIQTTDIQTTHRYEVQLQVRSEFDSGVADFYDGIRDYLQESVAPAIAGCTAPPTGTSIRNVQFGTLNTINALECTRVGATNACNVPIPIAIYSDGDPPVGTPVIISTLIGENLSNIPRRDGLIDIYSEFDRMSGGNILLDTANEQIVSPGINGATNDGKGGNKVGEDTAIKGVVKGKKEKAVKEEKKEKKGEEEEKKGKKEEKKGKEEEKKGKEKKNERDKVTRTGTSMAAINDGAASQTNSSVQAGRVTGITLSAIAVIVALLLLCCRHRCMQESRRSQDAHAAYKASDDDSDDDDDGESTMASSQHHGDRDMGGDGGPRIYNVQTNDDDTTEVILTSWMKAQEKKRKKEMGFHDAHRQASNNTNKNEASTLNREKNYICC